MRSWLILPFLLFAFITSCVQNQDSPDYIISNHKLSSKVQAAADSLSKMTRVYQGERVIRFDNLLKVASSKDLIVLTENKAPIVRYYAFCGLLSKNYKDIKEVFYRHINDTIAIEYEAGCAVNASPVMKMMLDLLNPGNTDNPYRFGKPEYDKYNKIARRFNPQIEREKSYDEEIAGLVSPDLIRSDSKLYADSNYKEHYDRKLDSLPKRKNLAFSRDKDKIVATAYFDFNACNSHYPNIERRGDTVILKNQMLKKYLCDRQHRRIEKITFVINDSHKTKIKTVLTE